ncbi:glycosyltransferase family 2 protein [Pontibacter silvestris]|uniref:Glycosyltransferase family 2 protein n=1 Tax=Pontibacter silvestris TaxID=2305183 RepID=A0ABW4WY61_9BACT|nr:glycosyltransferase family 2 protein [Pontibacter silvestris]MCC9138824.1 glycosyltransferase family 2 protein [Pontibacter silvestris]
MNRFTLPEWVQQHLFQVHNLDSVPGDVLEQIKSRLTKFNVEEDPEVSIVIPAYNEEKNLLQTLSSLSEIRTTYRTEILVVNNNSTDRTQDLLNACGVRSIFEPRQGISFTRQTGLENARGKYILNADADSIYPVGWVDVYVNALQDPAVSCVHGNHSFIPSKESSRFGLACHELIAESMFKFRSKTRGFTNVLGFNFAFRKADGLKVGGFNTKRQRWQDGWMAMMLMQVGRIQRVTSPDARVWTSDRRLIIDGGPSQAFMKRVKKHSRNLLKYAGIKSFDDNHDTPVKA